MIYLFRLFRAKILRNACLRFDRYICKGMGFDYTETYAFFILVFFLQLVCKIFIAFISHDCQRIYRKTMLAYSVLIYAQPESSANLLPLLDFAPAFVQSTDLEHIGIVPALTQSRM